jgi:cation transport regulator ChaB
MALTKQTPEEIKAQLKVKAQGVENTLALTYHNRSNEQYDQAARKRGRRPGDRAHERATGAVRRQVVR